MQKTVTLIMAVLLAGCSFSQPATQKVSFNCDQPLTTLVVNGKKQPECPITIEVICNNRMLVEAHKDGYDQYKTEIGYHLNGYGTADIVGTAFLFFPVFGVLASGAYDLDQDKVDIVLTKK